MGYDKYLLVLIGVWILFLPFLTPGVIGNDPVGYYVYARSFIIDGDLDFANEYEYYTEKFDIGIREHPETGKIFNQYLIGTSLFWAPFVLLAHLFSLLFGFAANGYSFLYGLFVTFGSSLYGLLGLVMMYKLAKEFVEAKFALLGVGGFWLSSHLFYYMYIQPSMSHAISFFSVSLMIYYWYFNLRRRPDLFRWCLFGIIAGLSFLVRVQNGGYLVIPLVYYIASLIGIKSFNEFKKITLGPVIGAVMFFVTLIPQFFVWKSLTGGFLYWFTGIYGAGSGAGFQIMNVIPVLFSNRHGLFNWTPVFLLGIVGFIFLYKQDKKLVIAFLIAFLVQIIVAASWHRWWGGFSYGNRFLLSTAAICMIGFAVLLDRMKERGWLVYLVPAGLIGWNFNLMLQYGSGMICPSCPASPFEVLKNTFTKVPNRFISILKRFFLDRGSFL